MYEALKFRAGGNKLTNFLRMLYDGMKCQIQVCADKIDFSIEAGTRQGGVESPPV